MGGAVLNENYWSSAQLNADSALDEAIWEERHC
jgi:hypothetical protein